MCAMSAKPMDCNSVASVHFQCSQYKYNYNVLHLHYAWVQYAQQKYLQNQHIKSMYIFLLQ